MANLPNNFNMNNFNEESQFSQELFNNFIISEPNGTLIDISQCVPIQSLQYSVPNNVVKENETIVSPNNRFSPFTSPSSSRSSSISSIQSHVKFGTYNPMDWTSQTIMDLLQSTNDGRFILADAKLNNGSLSDEGQNTLTKLLINFMFQDKSKGTALFFRKISSLIPEIFPNEEQRVYFLPARAEGSNQTHAKGKLVERWKNVARRLRSVGAIELDRRKSSPLLNIESATDFSGDIKKAKEWLQNEGLSASFIEVKDKWILTHEIRKSEISTKNGRNLSDVFKSWVILRSPKGHELISEDFFLEYPSQKTLFADFQAYHKKWTTVLNILVNIRRSSTKDKHAKDLLSKLDSVQLHEDHKTADVLTLLLIPYLIPTITIIRKCDASGVKKNWKPSLEESAKSFVTFVPNITQISSEIIQRQNKYSQYGCTIQPFVYLVGEDYSSVSQSYVRVDDQLWTFSSSLAAIDACFKAYFGLYCAYPRECYESWIFLQHQIYGIKTEYDQISSITFLLDSLVSEHNKLYLFLSKGTLKPKFHMLTHYGHILRKNGPFTLTSSMVSMCGLYSCAVRSG